MADFFQQFSNNLGQAPINILLALAILIIGWILALLVSVFIHKIIIATKLDGYLSKLLSPNEKPIKASVIISKVIFYIIMIFVLVAFFRILGLSSISEPLSILTTDIISFLPKLMAGIALLLSAWLIASILRLLIRTTLSTTKFDKRVASQLGTDENTAISFSNTISNVVYWLVFLLFFPAVLHSLNLGPILKPVNNMLDKFLSFIPNIFAAFLIILFGWFLAKIVKQITEGLLINLGIENLSKNTAVNQFIGQHKISSIISNVIYIMILISVIIAGLNSLQLESIAGPATQMLLMFLKAIPSIIAAAILLTVTYLLAKIIGGMAHNVLSAIGFNRLFLNLGLLPIEKAKSEAPSKVAGKVIMIALIMLATIESANLLGFSDLASLVKRFLQFSSNILLGLFIFAIGLYLSQLAQKLILSSSINHSNFLSLLAKYSILIMAAAMGLGEMGIAQSIVNMGFAIIFGAISLALAISFGFGCKEIAGRELDNFLKKIKK